VLLRFDKGHITDKNLACGAIGPRYHLFHNLHSAKRPPETFTHAQESLSAASPFLQVGIGDLLPLLEKFPTQGLGQSQFEAIKVQCSLRLLQNQMNAEHMYFFGKVLGVRSDHYVVFSTVGCRASVTARRIASSGSR
jgi:hypothetical protein